MTAGFALRDALPPDAAAIERLYAAAFPQEDLLPLLRDLPVLGPALLALVAVGDGGPVGHVAFTRCGIEGRAGSAVALLGPLAVAPDRQRQGIGSALVRAGLQRLAQDGLHQVQVLGDPAYYGRFGFTQDAAVLPPYPLPLAWRTAWQSLRLRPHSAALQGMLVVPPPWQRVALWAP